LVDSFEQDELFAISNS